MSMIRHGQYPEFRLSRLGIASLLSLLFLISPLSSQNSSPPSPDFNGNGTVDFPDFLLFANAFGSQAGQEKYESKYDLDGDGEIGFPDFILFASTFGQTVNTSPDLVVASMTAPHGPSVDMEQPFAFTLDVTVENKGNGPSAATTLRYYRSTDTTFSASDTQVGTGAVNGLEASATSNERIDLTTQPSEGTYYIACVDAVSEESNTENNCHSIQVGAAPTPPPPTPQLTITANNASVTEGTAATFTVTASSAPTSALTVNVNVSETEDVISGTPPSTVTINANETTATLTVNTANDQADEPNSVVTAQLQTGTGYTLGTQNSASVTVEDNDSPPPPPPTPQLTITASSTTITEGTAATFTITASLAPTTTLTVNVNVSENGNVISGTPSSTVTINANETTATLTVNTANDQADEPNSVVTAQLQTGTGYTLGTQNSASVTVEDNDSPPRLPPPPPPPPTPQVIITASSTTITEGTAATFTITASSAPTSALTVNVDVSEDGDVIRGTPSSTVTIDANKTTVTLTVNTVNDQRDEPNSVVTAKLQGGTGYTVGASSSASVTVNDNDIPEVTISAGTTPVTEGTSATFTITASPAPATTLTVNVDVSETANVISGTPSSTMTIDADETTATLTVNTVNDQRDEPNSVITAELETGTSYTVGASSSASVTVSDNDDPPPGTPEVTISAGTTPVTEGTAATFTIAVSPAQTTALAVNVKVTETEDVISGTPASTVTINANATTATLTVATDDDDADESNSVVTAEVETGTGYTVGSSSSASVTVEDDDNPPPPQTSPDLTFIAVVVGSGPSEEGTFVRFVILIGNVGDGASAASTLRYFRSTDATITASDTQVGMDAVAGLAASGDSRHTLEVNPPSSPGTYYYGVCVDAVAGESVTSNNCSRGARVVVPGPVARVEVTPREVTLAALGNTATLTARVLDAQGNKIYGEAVSWSTVSPEVATVDAAGVVTAVANGRATVTASASGLSGMATVIVDQRMVSVDIDPGEVELTSVDETAELTLRAFDANGHEAPYATEGLIAWRSSNLNVATVSSVGGLTAEVRAIGAGTATVTVTLDDGSLSATAQVTVLKSALQDSDDETPQVTITANTASVTEGTAATFTITASSAPTSALTVNVDVSEDGDAISGTAPSTVTIDANATTATLTVATDDDDADEDASKVTAKVETGTGYTVGSTSSASVAVEDNDNPPPPSTPDLVVESPSVSNSRPVAGASFTLSAEVSNTGDGRSPATTLRYYRSTDATIATSDTAVGTDVVGALAASGTSAQSISLTAPATAGTYYYGACVDEVTDESDTTNNCSGSVSVTVVVQETQPDLTVTLSITPPSGGIFHVGSSFRFGATVRNAGDGASTATTLRYYQSKDAPIRTPDTEIRTDAVGALAAPGVSAESISLTAPSTAGTYYYNACVDAVAGESNTTNNCSFVSIGVTVVPEADLVVGSPSVTDSSPETGDSFTLSATVGNDGDGAAAATTLRYYRSTDGTITTSDTEEGTDAMRGLSAGATRSESISLTAPTTAGTYYYGACVDTVTGESDTTNNCSSSVTVTVAEPEPDLIVDSFTITLGPTLETSPGALVYLNQRVANVGDAASAATTVRYYRSTDATITTSDTQVSTDAVPELAASSRFVEVHSERLPTAPGTYYYGACVDAVAGESNTANNCSRSVKVTVPEPQPDLVVSASVDDGNLNTGDSFTLSATVRNAGDEQSAATTLRYYRSTDSRISSSDTQVDTDAVGALAASGTSAESISLTAPSTAGAYYYGACVDAVTDESDTTNNCSSSVTIAVEEESSGQPDLRIVGVIAITSLDGVFPGSLIQFSASVRNYGDANSDATTLRYYRSTDATISVSDTKVGTDEVSALVPSGQVSEGIDLTAPSTADTYYYGACVDAVTGESDTTNNCSGSVQVDVE